MARSAKPFGMSKASRGTFTLRTAGAFLAFALVLGSMSGLACAGRAVAAEAVGYLAEDAFFSGGLGNGIDLDRRNLTGKGGSYKGGEPGLYGGSRNKSVCDEQLLLDFLLKPGNSKKKAAWAKALDIAKSDKNVRKYVKSLTEVVLANDTLVANHNYDKKKRKADRYDALLEAGIAVLVDVYGVPRVKCNCGNPLAVSDRSPGDIDDLEFKGKDKGNKKWKVKKDRVIRVEKPADNQKSLAVVNVEDPGERIKIDLPPEPDLTGSDSDSDSDDKTKDPDQDQDQDQVTVPKVRGMSEAEATQLLKDEGFAVETRSVEDSGVEPGLASGTDPASDSQAPARSTITLLIESGATEGTVAVPRVVGLPQADAESRIEAAGLAYSVTFEPAAAEQVGFVTAQHPLPGQAAEAGSKVNLVVGSATVGDELDGGAEGDTQDGAEGEQGGTAGP